MENIYNTPFEEKKLVLQVQIPVIPSNSGFQKNVQVSQKIDLVTLQVPYNFYDTNVLSTPTEEAFKIAKAEISLFFS